MSKKILHLVIKNTSSLDFVLPLFWKLRKEHPDYSLSILYCVFNKKSILRGSSYYSETFSSINVQEYDFSYFTKRWFYWLSFIFKKLLSSPRADKLSFLEIKKKLYKLDLCAIRDLFSLIFEKILYVWVNAIVDFERIMLFFSPDIILLDNRSRTKFPGKDEMFNYMYTEQKRVVLIPHAPHYRDPVSEFCPFDEDGESFPDFCEHWMPMKFGTPWKSLGWNMPNKRFIYSGYPGFDKEWLNFCMRAKLDKNEKHKVLFVIRRFLDKDVKREKNTDYYILDFDEFYSNLILLKEAIIKQTSQIDVIIKPHPSNNYKKLRRVLKDVGLVNAQISYEPIYALLPIIDVVVSLPSTISLIPAMAGIPTLVLNTPLQQKIHNKWKILEELYSSMCYFIDNPNHELSSVLNQCLEKKCDCKDDRFLRNYFKEFSLKSLNL